MARLLYTLLFYLLQPLLWLRLYWRGRRAPAYRRRWLERYGITPGQPPRGAVWLHTVSVGETLTAIPLVEALLAHYPDLPVVMTTTTPTGSDRVRAAFGDRVYHCYAPWDLPGALARFLRRTEPRLALFMETELWPNTLAALARRRIPTVLINARLSARSARGYQRLSSLSQPMLARLALIAAQYQADADRFVELGVESERVAVCGSLKFDIQPSPAQREAAEQLRGQIGARPVWLAASTHPGEHEQVIAAHQQLLRSHPEVLLILVPRHPEQFEPVAQQLARAGLAYQRRSVGRIEAKPPMQVLLGDTMGELMALIGAADLVFVGGSLVENGGHNLMEPAAWGKPVLTGPSLFNFATVAERMREADALLQVDDPNELARELRALLELPEWCHTLGLRGQAVVAANQGALPRLLTQLAPWLPAPRSGG